MISFNDFFVCIKPSYHKIHDSSIRSLFKNVHANKAMQFCEYNSIIMPFKCYNLSLAWTYHPIYLF